MTTIMQVELITKDDLQLFRQQLLEDLKPYLSAPATARTSEYLKGSEVRAMLKISAGTLQNLRVNGAIKPVKIMGTYYYKASEITEMLNKPKR
jgi:hypothetical protein